LVAYVERCWRPASITLLGALISLIGFAVARGAGASLLRAVVYSLFVLVCAVIIAVLKNLLAGH
jgi:hypothetical protein